MPSRAVLISKVEWQCLSLHRKINIIIHICINFYSPVKHDVKKRAIILHLLLFFPFNENRKSFQQPPSPPASSGTFLFWTELCVECLPNKCFPKKCGMKDSAVTLDVSRRMIGKMKVLQVADAFFLDVQVMQEIRYPSGKLSWTLFSLEQQCSSLPTSAHSCPFSFMPKWR